MRDAQEASDEAREFPISRGNRRDNRHTTVFLFLFFFFFSHPPGKSRADEVADLGGGWRCFTWLRGWWTLSGE